MDGGTSGTTEAFATVATDKPFGDAGWNLADGGAGGQSGQHRDNQGAEREPGRTAKKRNILHRETNARDREGVGVASSNRVRPHSGHPAFQAASFLTNLETFRARMGLAALVGMLAIASTTLAQSPHIALYSHEHLSTWVSSDNDSWHIRHTKSIAGSFVLFRNSTLSVLTVLIDGVDKKLLAPREAVIWDCQTGRSVGRLVVGMEDGDLLYVTPVECGDAVVARTYFPSGETAVPASGDPVAVRSRLPAIVSSSESGVASLERTSSTIQLSGTNWRVRHTGNSEGTFMLFRNGGGAVSVIKDGETPRPVAPRETVTWPCKGPDEFDASIVVHAEGGGIVHTGYLQCGDALYITSDAGGG